MLDLKTTLESAKTIAIMGCSDHPVRISNRIARYLLEVGYRIVPVNPYHEEVLGIRCYPDLEQVPDTIHLDIVNIFRQPRYTADMVQQAIHRTQLTDEAPTIWTQLGVSSSEAERLATEAELSYVRNRCISVEHARLLG